MWDVYKLVLLIICVIFTVGGYRFARNLDNQSARGNFNEAFMSLLALIVCIVLGFSALSHLMK